MSDEIVDIYQGQSYRYTYSAAHEPIAHVEPGQRVRIHCVDCFENRLVREDQKFSEVCEYPYVNPQTGPVFVNGAEEGDTLLEAEPSESLDPQFGEEPMDTQFVVDSQSSHARSKDDEERAREARDMVRDKKALLVVMSPLGAMLKANGCEDWEKNLGEQESIK